MDKYNTTQHQTQPGTTLADLGEFGLIDRIKQQVRQSPKILTGIGDDCSACILPPGEVLLTTKDLLLEDIHFRRDWTDMYSLGWKSAAVNLSDVAAMGGTAHYLYLGLGIPSETPVDDLQLFMDGFLDLCKQEDVNLCGGDTCRSAHGLCISVTVQGSVAPLQICKRSGARAGDTIYVSGTLGDSALALLQLQQHQTPDPEVAMRHHRPQPRLNLGRALAQRSLATAMIDVSDGIFSDLGHILQHSNVGAEIDTRLIPLSAAATTYIKQHPHERERIIRGGEDYELLFTCPAQHQHQIAALSAQLQFPLTPVGRIVAAEDGFSQINHSGRKCAASATGFNHFRA